MLAYASDKLIYVKPVRLLGNEIAKHRDRYSHRFAEPKVWNRLGLGSHSGKQLQADCV